MWHLSMANKHTQTITYKNTLAYLSVCVWRRTGWLTAVDCNVYEIQFQNENLINRWIHTNVAFHFFLMKQMPCTIFLALGKQFFFICCFINASHCRKFMIQVKTDTRYTMNVNGLQLFYNQGYFFVALCFLFTYLFIYFFRSKQIFLEKKQTMCAILSK